jgi:hypothetical protein
MKLRRWHLRFAASMLLAAAMDGLSMGQAAQLPDAPSAAQGMRYAETPAKPAGFFTFRKGPGFPPLRSTKEVFGSKLFWGLHGAYVAAVITDIRFTHGRREDWGSEGPVIPVVVGADYLMDRFFSRAFSVEAPVYGIQHYVRDAMK